ncbi:MAG: hypothetical protein PWP65_1529 [Clostridia bacterium]|nr:hypothetical protein [Clostridia bacterium]
MLILGLNGSPHKDGNTAHLLKISLEEASNLGAETRLIHIVDALEGQKDPFCRQCANPCPGNCARGKPLGEAYDLLRRADGIILGSPVYFGTVSAQLKAFWDKSRVLRNDKALLNVVGGGISVGRIRFGGQETTLKTMFDMMLVQGMIVVGDGCEDSDCGHHGGCGQVPATGDTFAAERVRCLGRRVAQVAGATSSLRRR